MKLNHRHRTRTGWLATGLLCAHSSAFACMAHGLHGSPPTFVLVWGTVLLVVALLTLFLLALIALLTFALCGTQRLHALRHSLLSPLRLGTSLMAIALAVIDAWAIPHYTAMFSSFGADLPTITTTFLALRHSLWLPILWLMALWLANTLSPKQTRWNKLWWATLLTQIGLLFWVSMALYAPIFKLS